MCILAYGWLSATGWGITLFGAGHLKHRFHSLDRAERQVVHNELVYVFVAVNDEQVVPERQQGLTRVVLERRERLVRSLAFGEREDLVWEQAEPVWESVVVGRLELDRATASTIHTGNEAFFDRRLPEGFCDRWVYPFLLRHMRIRA